jgi:hypothetical protein
MPGLVAAVVAPGEQEGGHADDMSMGGMPGGQPPGDDDIPF